MASAPITGTGTFLPPPNVLVAANSNPPLFPMFTDDWLQLQAYIAQTLQLPITSGDFTTKYGTFSDEAEVESVVAAMQAVQGLSTQFGDPTKLFADLGSDPAILEATTPPADLYTNIVWTAYQIYNAASTFTDTFQQFRDLLNPATCGTPTQCGQTLVEILTGEGGLQSTAVTTVATCNQLISAMSNFNTSMATPNATIQTYTSSSSQFYKDAVSAAGQDASDVVTFQQDADAAYTQWKDYTIAAVTVSVGLVIISGGMLWPAAAVAAGVLGHDAVEARDKYNEYCAERDAAAADEKLKQQLVVDLGGLNSAVKNVSNAAASFLTTLSQVAAAWTTIGQDLAHIVHTYTPEQLAKYSWVNQALHCEDAVKEWQTIATAAQAFTQNSLVPFSTHTFGDPLPTSGNG